MILALITITMDLLLSIFYLFNVNNGPVNVLNTTLLLTLNSFNNFTRTKSRLYNIALNQSRGINIRTAHRHIISMKTLIKTGVTLVMVVRNQLSPYSQMESKVSY